jgi:hypothetical protein
MEVDHPGSQQCVEMGWGNVALPIAKLGQNKYYINARKRIDIEKLIHFERDNLTGIVLVRVPLSSRTFAFKVESYRRMSWTSPNSTSLLILFP